MKLNKNYFFLFPILFCMISLNPFHKNSDSEAPVEEIQDWQARLELARVLSYQKKYEESIQEYRKVLSEKPDSLEAKIELAAALAYSGQEEESLKSIQSLPLDKLKKTQLAQLANIYAILKQYDRAESLYLDYLSHHPEDLKVRVKYAEMLSWAKRYEDAIHQFEWILSKKPDDIQVRRKYAFVLIWMGDEDKGAEELRKTLKDTSSSL